MAVFPFGLTAEVAASILRVGMPPELVVRYLAEDGRFPADMASALEGFSTVGTRFITSGHDRPVRYDGWVEQRVGGYYVPGAAADSASFALRVPVVSDGDIQVMVHAISASALGLLEVPMWQPHISEGEASGDEKVKKAPIQAAGYWPRYVSDPEMKPIEFVRPRQSGFIYDIEQSRQLGGPATRLAIGPGSIRDDILMRLSTLDTDTAIDKFEMHGERRVIENGHGVERVEVIAGTELKEVSPVEMVTPGGTVVVSIRASVFEELAQGKCVTNVDADSFMRSVKGNLEGFVNSNAFSAWNDFWFGVLRTLADEGNLSMWKRRNWTDRVVSLLFLLYKRYATAVRVVCESSYVKASFFRTLFSSSATFETLYEKRARKGEVDIVHSKRFFERLYSLRATFAEAQVAMERKNLFAPGTVSEMQDMLPVAKATGVSHVDAVRRGGARIMKIGWR